MASKDTFSRFSEIPQGDAPDVITEGTLVLEGGAWRGVYTQGALDVLMQEGLMFRNTVGCSAGAMSALGYLSGQIGYCTRINLTHRPDREYCGTGALRRDHGVTGFSHLFLDLMEEYPFNKDRFMSPDRELYVTATCLEDGKTVYFRKGHCDIFRAIRASATVPYVSRPVVIRGRAYLDGGCTVKIPYEFARSLGTDKLMVIRTQDRSYRKKDKKINTADRILYKRHPEFLEGFLNSHDLYNETIEQMNQDEADGRIFVLAPSSPVEISRFEGNVEKLGELYELGRDDMRARLEDLRTYLAS